MKVLLIVAVALVCCAGFLTAHRLAGPRLGWRLVPLVAGALPVLALQTAILLELGTNEQAATEDLETALLVLPVASATLVGVYLPVLLALVVGARPSLPRAAASALVAAALLAWAGFVWVVGIVTYLDSEYDVCLPPAYADLGGCTLGPD